MEGFPFKSVREWIDFLEKKGDLLRIREEVDLRGEIDAICRKNALRDGPALLFENIRGYPGWRCLKESLTARRRMAWAVNIDDPKGFVRRMASKIERQVPPVQVETGPVKEIKIIGEDVDLIKFPFPISGAFEVTPNVNGAVHTCKDPETGWQNVSIRRLGVKSERHGTTYLTRTQQDSIIYGIWRKRGEPMPCAYVIGADPVLELVSQLKAPMGYCEYDFWGAITGRPLEVVKCETLDLFVPAHAEIVIEGEVPVDERELDTPYQEAWGYHCGCSVTPKFIVKCITMRRDAIYRDISSGWVPNETHRMGGAMAAVSVLRELQKEFPGVIDVNALAMGISLIVIQVEKSATKVWPGLAKYLGSITIFKIVPYCRTVVVVDEDTDIYNLEDIFFALANKFLPSKDMTVFEHIGGVGMLNPIEAWGNGYHTTEAIILDCTEPPPPYDGGYKRGIAKPTEKILRMVEEEWNKYGFKE